MLTWIVDRIQELVEWTLALDREFAFLVALPFIVAFTALVAEIVRKCWAVLSNTSDKNVE
jgi:hypothetical protein